MTTQNLKLYQDTVQQDRDNLVPIKPICELFDIDYRWQSEFIRKNEFLSTAVVKKPLRLPQGGGDKEQLFLSKKGFIFWVFQLNSKTVKTDLKDKLIQFQSNLLEYLYANTESRTNTLKQKIFIQREIVKIEEELENNDQYRKLVELKSQELRLSKEMKSYDTTITQGLLFGEE